MGAASCPDRNTAAGSNRKGSAMHYKTHDPEPLLAIAERRAIARRRAPGANGIDHASLTELAAEIDATPRQVSRWKAGARLAERTADRHAVALNLHPLLIWPDFYGSELDEVAA